MIERTGRARMGRVLICMAAASLALAFGHVRAAEPTYYDARFERLSRRFSEVEDVGTKATLLRRVFDVRYLVTKPDAVSEFLSAIAGDGTQARILGIKRRGSSVRWHSNQAI